MFESDSDDNIGDFKINEKYANNYEKWRNKEELQKLKDRYGDVDLNGDEETSSTDESEDDDAKEWNESMEKDFLKTLSLLKSKDKKIYEKNTVLFKNQNSNEISDDKKLKNSKPFYLKDLEREMVLKEMEKEEKGSIKQDDNEPKKPLNNKKSYFEEQDEIKKSFKQIKVDIEEENDDLLKVKSKSNEEKEKDEEEYRLWLKGQKKNVEDKDVEENMKYLHDYWNDPNLNENEKFLRDYILNKRYLDKDDDDEEENDDNHHFEVKNLNNVDPENVNLSEDEKIIETQETFEKKYNFRFEEPDEEFIKSYPRTINDTLRRKDSKRKEKRDEYKKRKELEKQKKKEEIKRLKNLKKQEIIEKIDKIKRITGNDDLNIDIDDLDKDFDAAEYDKKMQEMFDGKFYQNNNDDVKPEFSDSDPDIGIDDYYEDWAVEEELNENEGEEEEEENNKSKKRKKKKNKNKSDQVEDPEFNMDCDAEFIEKIPKKGKSKFAEALSKEKPLFDPNQKSFEDYINEYYKLDCEDIIGGDTLCRFKYREVIPNDFGLSVDEILIAKDNELNAWASLRKAIQFRPIKDELSDVKAYKDRSKNVDKKKKILESVYTENEEKDVEETELENEKKNEVKDDKIEINEEKIVKSKKKKQKTKVNNEDINKKEEVKEENGKKELKNNKNNKGKVNKNKKKKKKTVLETLTDERLQAYGINPKKFHKKLKYSNNNNNNKTNQNSK